MICAVSHAGAIGGGGGLQRSSVFGGAETFKLLRQEVVCHIAHPPAYMFGRRRVATKTDLKITYDVLVAMQKT